MNYRRKEKINNSRIPALARAPVRARASCYKGDQYFESHTVPYHLITCCSALKPGQNHYKARFRTCTALRVGKECQYSHEPQRETEQAPSPQQK